MIETQYIVVFFYFSHKIWYVRHSALSVIICAKQGRKRGARRLRTRFTVYYYASPLLGTLAFAPLLRIMLLFARGVRDGAERRRAFEPLPVVQKVLAQGGQKRQPFAAHRGGAESYCPAKVATSLTPRAALIFCLKQTRQGLWGTKNAPCITQRANLFGALRRYSVKIEEGSISSAQLG